jgi:hypothetical protein
MLDLGPRNWCASECNYIVNANFLQLRLVALLDTRASSINKIVEGLWSDCLWASGWRAQEYTGPSAVRIVCRAPSGLRSVGE